MHEFKNKKLVSLLKTLDSDARDVFCLFFVKSFNLKAIKLIINKNYIIEITKREVSPDKYITLIILFKPTHRANRLSFFELHGPRNNPNRNIPEQEFRWTIRSKPF